jgi:hypothetical protein
MWETEDEDGVNNSRQNYDRDRCSTIDDKLNPSMTLENKYIIGIDRLIRYNRLTVCSIPVVIISYTKISLVVLPLDVLSLCVLQGLAMSRKYAHKFYTYIPQSDQTFFSSIPLYITHSIYLPFWCLRRILIGKRQSIHLTHP